MQIIQEKNELQLNGITQKGEFQFKITPQAMQMFFKDIYKDPILACIRELACNAYDAHTMNGNPNVPFNVHIPTELEPYFEVRDFGVGLSKEGMETLYSTFFESAKQHTNDLIGGLGIGSKSPLAYTDMFTATSYFNGKMYQYLITKNEFGVPTWNFVGEFDSDEPNGLCINVPVKATHGKADYRDVEAFRKAAIKVFTRFGIKPNWTGAKLDVPNPEYSVQYGSWGVRKTNEYQGLMAIMGNIAYPINIDSLRLDDAMLKALRGIILTPQRNSWDSSKTPMNIDINFKIGELSITPSREELQYDNRTVDAIMAAFKRVQDEFLAETTKVINSKATYLDAIRYVIDLSSEMRKVVMANKIQYQGRDIELTFQLAVPTKEVEVEVEVQTPNGPEKQKQKTLIKQMQFEKLDLDQMIQYKNGNRAFGIGTSRYNGISDFDTTSVEPIFIVKDERIGNVIPKLFPLMRDKYWQGNSDRHIANTNTGKARTLRHLIGVVPNLSLTDKKEITKYITDMMKKIGLDKSVTIIYMSDLKEDASLKPVRGAAANAGKTYKFKTLDLNKVFGNTKNVQDIMKIAQGNVKGFEDEEVEVKKTKGICYVVTSYGASPTWNHKYVTAPEMLVALRLCGVEKIVSVPPQRMSNHIRNEWVKLEKVVTKEQIVKRLSKHVKGTDASIAIGWESLYNGVLRQNKVSTFMDFMDEKCGGVVNIPKLRTLKSWMAAVEKEANDNRTNFQARLAKFFDMEVSTNTNGTFNLNKFFEDTKKHGDVQQIVEEIVPVVGLIEWPHRYYWRDASIQPKVKAVKILVDKLTK